MEKVFDKWRGLELDRVLYECRELLDDETFPSVRRWREQGGKVVGHFQVYFPEELVHAAGALPVKVCGAPIEAMLSNELRGHMQLGGFGCSRKRKPKRDPHKVFHAILSRRVGTNSRRESF